MKSRYASMPNWFYKFFGITEEQDKYAFRQHDHDYGRAGYVIDGYARAETRRHADDMLVFRLVLSGMPSWKAKILWLGCRLFLAHKWRV